MSDPRSLNVGVRSAFLHCLAEVSSTGPHRAHLPPRCTANLVHHCAAQAELANATGGVLAELTHFRACCGIPARERERERATHSALASGALLDCLPSVHRVCRTGTGVRRHISPAVLRWPRAHVSAALALAASVAATEGAGRPRPFAFNFVGDLSGGGANAERERRWVADFASSYFTAHSSFYVDTSPPSSDRGSRNNNATAGRGYHGGYAPLGPWDMTLERRYTSFRPKSATGPRVAHCHTVHLPSAHWMRIRCTLFGTGL